MEKGVENKMIGKIMTFILGFVLGTLFGTAVGRWFFEQFVNFLQSR